MTNYEKLGFDEIVRWLARADCENCLAQKYCYKRLSEDKFISCDGIIKEYLELDSIKSEKYFLTFKDIDEIDEEDKIDEIDNEEVEPELWIRGL